MNREDYRKAFDAVQFSPDFQERTKAALHQAAANINKEDSTMHVKQRTKTGILAAAVAAVLVVGAAAAALLLSPGDVAREAGDPALAAAFESDSAQVLNETQTSDGVAFTLQGIVSGAALSEFTQDADAAQTYAVLSLSNTDGTPMTGDDAFTVTPLVEGYPAHVVNGWTLGGGYVSFVREGVLYYLFACDSLEMFADHTVVLAAYEGFGASPGTDVIAVAEDGSFGFADGLAGAKAMFILPLDKSAADPAAAQAFLDGTGLMDPAG